MWASNYSGAICCRGVSKDLVDSMNYLVFI